MKAFITGGTGFIGSHLVDHLVKNGVETRCLVHTTERWLEGKPYTPIKGSLHDIEALKKGLENVDTLFHLAAILKAKTRSDFLHTNVEATENLIRIAQRTGVKRIVVLSSLAAAGPSLNRPLTEEDPMQPVSMYGISKKMMEERIEQMNAPEMTISILRPPAVYGPREEDIYAFFKIASKHICPIIGDGETPRLSLIHVFDVVQGLWLAAQRNDPGLKKYFISSEQIYTWNQIKWATEQALGHKTVPIHVSPGTVKKLASLVEKTVSLWGG
ncbi:MAG TPA: NAD(P)-dependent oxidoreductase, partial [Balneolales bacterium]|nr:NAD(P)-dependent oxidoreductase [Balneolales bacterium]